MMANFDMMFFQHALEDGSAEAQEAIDAYLEECPDCCYRKFEPIRLGNLSLTEYIANAMCQMRNPPAKSTNSLRMQAVLNKLKIPNPQMYELAIQTHEDARHLQCYNNCIRYCALNKDYTCVTGWLLFETTERAQAEHHCVVRNTKTGELKEISVHPGCRTVSFVPDNRIGGIDILAYNLTVRPAAIAIVVCEDKPEHLVRERQDAYWRFVSHKQKRLMMTCALVCLVFGLK